MSQTHTRWEYHRRKMRPEAVENLKQKIRDCKDASAQYSYEINRWERSFVCAFKNRPPADFSLAVCYQAQFEVPLLQMKDHLDFVTGRLEAMLPDEEQPYHPQEPEADPFAHIKNRFR